MLWSTGFRELLRRVGIDSRLRVAMLLFGFVWLAVAVVGVVFVGNGRWLLWWYLVLVIAALALAPFELRRLLRDPRGWLPLLRPNKGFGPGRSRRNPDQP